jgi:hypothetical protein
MSDEINTVKKKTRHLQRSSFDSNEENIDSLGADRSNKLNKMQQKKQKQLTDYTNMQDPYRLDEREDETFEILQKELQSNKHYRPAIQKSGT